MAMNADTLAQAIVDQLEIQLDFTFTPEQEAKAKLTWKAVATALIAHVASSATITLAQGDVDILPGTFTAGATPVTGEGENEAVALTGKIS
jgi:hypothetical protein